MNTQATMADWYKLVMWRITGQEGETEILQRNLYFGWSSEMVKRDLPKEKTQIRRQSEIYNSRQGQKAEYICPVDSKEQKASIYDALETNDTNWTNSETYMKCLHV